MIKQITVAECDICGRTEKDYKLPPGWMLSEANRQFCICPRCWAKLTKE